MLIPENKKNLETETTGRRIYFGQLDVFRFLAAMSIVVYHTYSGNFDKPGFMVQEDGSLTILWDKDFGGTGADHLNVIVPANDGGFLLCGNSSSGIGGDKTQANQGLL